jgi:hypothetical protein
VIVGEGATQPGSDDRSDKPADSWLRLPPVGEHIEELLAGLTHRTAARLAIEASFRRRVEADPSLRYVPDLDSQPELVDVMRVLDCCSVQVSEALGYWLNSDVVLDRIATLRHGPRPTEVRIAMVQSLQRQVPRNPDLLATDLSRDATQHPALRHVFEILESAARLARHGVDDRSAAKAVAELAILELLSRLRDLPETPPALRQAAREYLHELSYPSSLAKWTELPPRKTAVSLEITDMAGIERDSRSRLRDWWRWYIPLHSRLLASAPNESNREGLTKALMDEGRMAHHRLREVRQELDRCLKSVQRQEELAKDGGSQRNRVTAEYQYLDLVWYGRFWLWWELLFAQLAVVQKPDLLLRRRPGALSPADIEETYNRVRAVDYKLARQAVIDGILSPVALDGYSWPLRGSAPILGMMARELYGDLVPDKRPPLKKRTASRTKQPGALRLIAGGGR